jgi:hypothetical protein
MLIGVVLKLAATALSACRTRDPDEARAAGACKARGRCLFANFVDLVVSVTRRVSWRTRPDNDFVFRKLAALLSVAVWMDDVEFSDDPIVRCRRATQLVSADNPVGAKGGGWRLQPTRHDASTAMKSVRKQSSLRGLNYARNSCCVMTIRADRLNVA